MKVERIVKRTNDTASIFLDDQSELILSYEVIIKNGLRKGDEISESLFYLFKEENNKHLIRKKAFALLARRIHSSRELQIKLLQKRFEKKLIDEVIKNLSESKLINDELFAQIFLEEKSRTKHWGKSKLKIELMKRGIQRNIVDNIIPTSFIEDEEQIKTLASKKMNILKKRNYTGQQIKQKLFSFLLSKGYDFESIRKCTQKILLNNDENSDD